MDRSNNRVVVLGAGASGIAACELLLSQKASVTLRDGKLFSNDALKALEAKGVNIQLGQETYGGLFFDLCVISPGVSPETKMAQEIYDAGIPVISEIELGYQGCGVPVIAVTGTNGKSTTTQLIDEVLKESGKRSIACGNIGRPFSDVVLKEGALDYVVVEVSSFQLEAIQDFKPHIGIYLNFSPDHMDRYSNEREYQQAKWKLFQNQSAEEYAVVNARCELPEVKSEVVTFDAQGGKADYLFQEGRLLAKGRQVVCQKDTSLQGVHNAENQLATLAVADILGIDNNVVVKVFQNYKALPHRCEFVGNVRGVSYINDSKATNPDALEKALLGQEKPVLLIAGGKDKGLSNDSITRSIGKHVRAAILIGETRKEMGKAWRNKVKCFEASTLEEAVAISCREARSGETVLFSPGCSSFDMFKNYEERGEKFRDLVSQISESNHKEQNYE